MAEMAVAAGARKPAPLAPTYHTPQASPSAGAPDRSPLHHHERGSPMKNRKREICTSGSVRDEVGQPPHLLGRRRLLYFSLIAVTTGFAIALAAPTASDAAEIK